jgi:sporulation protein YlmC with PRC-barrel domain
MAADHAFDIDSTVGQYWLAHGTGFEVVEDDGRKLGVVADVVLDPATQHASLVLVRRRAPRRPAVLPPRELRLVVPASKRFVVDHRPSSGNQLNLHEAGAKTAQTVGRLAVDVAAGTGRISRLLAAGTERLAVGALTWARREWPAVRRGSAAAASWLGDALLAGWAAATALAAVWWRRTRGD